jgi:hypothetical protein
LAGTFEGRRAEKIERYTDTSRGSSSKREREREREREKTYRGGCRRGYKDDDEDPEEEE